MKTRQSRAGTFVILALAAIVFATCVLALVESATPAGDFGLRFGVASDRVASVAPSSPADIAGVLPGDEIVKSETSLRDYATAVGLVRPAVGDRVQLHMARGIRTWAATLVARGESAPAGHTLSTVVAVLATLSLLFVATALVLLRPSWMTWGFFLFSLTPPIVSLPSGAPLWLFPFWQMYFAFAVSVGVAGILIFFACFPEPTVQYTWRVWVVRIAVVAAVVMVVAFPNGLLAGATFRNVYAFGSGFNTAQLFVLSLYALAAAAFLSRFAQSDAADRQRMAWVVLALMGAVFAFVPYVLATWTTNDAVRYTLIAIGNAILIPVPIAVAYAVLHEHVLNITVAISRGLVYTILSGVIVAVFASVDWFVGSFVSSARWAAPAEFCTAIALGFWLNSAHHRVDRFVDLTLFRKRHEAEERLRRVSAGLEDAASPAEIVRALTVETCQALDLQYAVVFVRAEKGGFDCAGLAGNVEAPPAISADVPLWLHVRGERGRPLRLRNVPLDQIPLHPVPVLALPILVRNLIHGLVLCGPHSNGGDFEPDELDLLEKLVRAAASGYDALDLQEAQRTIESLRKQLMPGTPEPL